MTGSTLPLAAFFVLNSVGFTVYLVHLLCAGTAVEKWLRLTGVILVIGVLAFIVSVVAPNEYVKNARRWKS